jgi:RNAse (barnase) inhibitor barstar
MTVASVVEIDCDKILGWKSFHDEFARAFGFPEFYGKNMNAWIDCLTYLDDPQDTMTTVHCEPNSVVTLQLRNVGPLRERSVELYAAILECSAFVNWRRIESGKAPVLALSFWQ